jgi:hypothetical protein
MRHTEKREETQWKVNTIIATSMSTNTLILTHMSTPTTSLRTLTSTTTSTNTSMSMNMRTSIPTQTILSNTSTRIRGNTARTTIRTNRRRWNHTTTPTNRKPMPAAGSHHDG